MAIIPSDGPGTRGNRSVLAVGIAVVAALLVFFAYLSGPSGWRGALVVNAVPKGPVAELTARGDQQCTAVVEVPKSAGRAEIPVQTGAETVRARVDVRGIGARRRGAMETVPVVHGIIRLPLPADVPSGQSASVCVRSGQRESVTIIGDGNSASLRLVGTERQSRFSQLGNELGRVGKAKGFPLGLLGGWGALFLGVGTLGLAIGIATWVWSRGHEWRPGRWTWMAVMLVAVMHAWTWAILVPPFQVPDESSHFQYASYIADHGELPTGKVTGQPPYSESHARAEELVQTSSVAFNPGLRPPWSEVAQDEIQRALRGTSLDVPDVSTNATSQPPLYYISVVPAAIGGGDALDVLARMRLLSGLWLAIAALGAVALVRAAAPQRPRWAVAAGLSVALFPLLGFLAGGVTPDVAMTALSLWAFAAAIRCWRRGPDARNLAAFGLLVVLLALTKLTALAVVPGLLVIVAIALGREWRSRGAASVLAPLGRAAVVAAVPAVLYVAFTILSGRPVIPGVVGSIASVPDGAGATPAGNVRESLTATWQLFLPRLPFMQDFFPVNPFWAIWMDGLIGHFGYLDYNFSGSVRQLVTAAWVAIIALAGVGAVRIARARGIAASIVRHGPLLLGGIVAVAFLLLVIGRTDYHSRLIGGPPFQQARYLLPALPVALLAVPLALRSVGSRAAPYLGVVLVGGSSFWALGAFAITLTRYYG